jgi:hypothetical protein
MKKLYIAVSLIVLSGHVILAQDFNKSLASARTSYDAGNLSDARFAMDQMLTSINQAIGQQIIKILPAQMGNMNYNEKQDNVSSSTSGSGLYVNRVYGNYPASAKIEISNNSPLITTLNASLSNPLLGGMMRNDNQKVVKIQGYKSMLNRNGTDGGKTSYELQIPMNNTLLSFKMDDATEDQITTFANTIPLQKIAQLAQ